LATSACIRIGKEPSGAGGDAGKGLSVEEEPALTGAAHGVRTAGLAIGAAILAHHGHTILLLVNDARRKDVSVSHGLGFAHRVRALVNQKERIRPSTGCAVGLTSAGRTLHIAISACPVCRVLPSSQWTRC